MTHAMELHQTVNLFRMLRIFILCVFALFAPASIADSIHIKSDLKYELAGNQLRIEGSLYLVGSTLYNARISIVTLDDRKMVLAAEYWQQRTSMSFVTTMKHDQPWRGEYPLLIEVAAQDNANAWLSVAISNSYFIDRIGSQIFVSNAPENIDRSTAPKIFIRDNRIEWRNISAENEKVRAITTSAPAWTLVSRYVTPNTSVLQLQQSPTIPILKRFEYPQSLAITWINNDEHYTQFVPWSIVSDNDREWHGTTEQQSIEALKNVPFWRDAASLYTISLSFLVVLIVVGGWRLKKENVSIGRFAAILLVLVSLFWMIGFLASEYWWDLSSMTGGDMASHFLYAHRFVDWFYQGSISNWMPEVFAGFPAFAYYFPFPFIVIALLSSIFDINIAIKLGVLLPGLLLPFAVTSLGRALQWSPLQRVCAAFAAIAFLMTTETSIWGGNWQATFSGEFAYEWGLSCAIFYFAALVRFLRAPSKKYFVLVVVLELFVAMSHGFAVIWAGLSSFALLIYSNQRFADFKKITAAHIGAFLLAGFWLVPLLMMSPWTIPNDGTLGQVSWNVLWGRSLWPLSIGLVLLPWYFRSNEQAKYSVAMLTGAIIVALFGYFMGRQFGLAEIRFYPFAQLSLAILFGLAIGWGIDHFKRPFIASIAVMCGLFAWWSPAANNIEQWARWNFDGYEHKVMWSLYRQLAMTTSGSLDGPRVVFEHDPDNVDLGSTRSLEALPYFGGRPVLEGLYMESAISSPFIYQIQADVSARPSSPLARYPVFGGSVEQAIARMREFYADTLILRSNEMKARFRNNENFDVILDRSPFLVLKLKEKQGELIEPVRNSLQPFPFQGWMEKSFQRFRTEFPYQNRFVFDEKFSANTVTASNETKVRVLEFSRDRIVFETDQPGVPILIRMTYNPRWHATNGDQIYLTEPAFMLVVPTTNRVELEYGYSNANYFGWLLTVLGIGFVVLAIGKFPQLFTLGTVHTISNRTMLVVTLVSLFALSASYFFRSDVEYFAAHRLMQDKSFANAAQLFDRAVEQRRVPAYHAEALFWAARAYELSGDRNSARQRYDRLVDEAPESFWWPESCYRLIEIALAEKNIDVANKLFARLEKYFSENQWTNAARKSLENDNRATWSQLLHR